MKKILITVIAVFSFTLSQAQTNAVKVNPIGLAFGVANAGYEFAVNDSNSVTFSALYYNINDVSGLGLGGEYRFYFSSKEALIGWHAGPSIGYASLEDDYNNSAKVFNIGAEAGHQWIFGEHFALDLFLGIGQSLGDLNGLDINSTSVGLGVSLGYAW